MKNPREELVLKEVKSTELTTRVTLKQQYRGIPVDAGARVFFDRKGEIELANVTYYDITDLSTTPQIDSATVENLALKQLGFPKGAKVANHKYQSEMFIAESLLHEELGLPQPAKNVNTERYATRLSIWRSDQGKFHLIWIVWVQQESPLHFWRYYIDAQDGTVLRKIDEIRD